jgi:hypothetical protein
VYQFGGEIFIKFVAQVIDINIHHVGIGAEMNIPYCLRDFDSGNYLRPVSEQK